MTRDKRTGTWYVQTWYKTYDGKCAHKVKRGFKTKPEVLAWERDFYAVHFYSLSSNPCRRVESMGSKSAGEMRFWTKDQYLRFSDEIMDKPLSFHAFETLYWCGVREGELLALKPRRRWRRSSPRSTSTPTSESPP